MAQKKKDDDKALVISISLTDPDVKKWVKGIIDDETMNLSKTVQKVIKKGI